MSNVVELAAHAMAEEILSSIPSGVRSWERGEWYARRSGYTGPTAYVSRGAIAQSDMSLAEWVSALLEWHEANG